MILQQSNLLYLIYSPLLSGNKIKVYNSNVLNSLAEAKAVLVNVRSLTRPCR